MAIRAQDGDVLPVIALRAVDPVAITKRLIPPADLALSIRLRANKISPHIAPVFGVGATVVMFTIKPINLAAVDIAALHSSGAIATLNSALLALVTHCNHYNTMGVFKGGAGR